MRLIRYMTQISLFKEYLMEMCWSAPAWVFSQSVVNSSLREDYQDMFNDESQNIHRE